MTPLLTSLPTRGDFAEAGGDNYLSGRHNTGWRAGNKRVRQGFMTGTRLSTTRLAEQVPMRHYEQGNEAEYIVHFDDCAVAWIERGGGWKTIHTRDFCAAPEVAQVEQVLRTAGIEWEELT